MMDQPLKKKIARMVQDPYFFMLNSSNALNPFIKSINLIVPLIAKEF